jgi:hypothetical protein
MENFIHWYVEQPCNLMSTIRNMNVYPAENIWLGVTVENQEQADVVVKLVRTEDIRIKANNEVIEKEVIIDPTKKYFMIADKQ